MISSYSEEEVRGAVEFLTYREKYSDIDDEKTSPLEKEYIAVFEQTEESFANYQFRWEEWLLDDFFNTAFPELLRGECDRAEFIRRMDEELKVIGNGG